MFAEEKATLLQNMDRNWVANGTGAGMMAVRLWKANLPTYACMDERKNTFRVCACKPTLFTFFSC